MKRTKFHTKPDKGFAETAVVFDTGVLYALNEFSSHPVQFGVEQDEYTKPLQRWVSVANLAWYMDAFTLHCIHNVLHWQVDS